MNTMRLDLNLLTVFAAIFDTGSVSAAAAKLNLSQPAVSHALNRLRKLTGDPLFVRSGQRLSATPRAIAMGAEARDIIAAARNVLTRAEFDPATGSAHFRLGASDYANMTLVPALMRHLRQVSAGSTLEIVQVSASIREHLADGKADLSFWGVAPPGSPFHSTMLFKERLTGAARRDHPLCQPRAERVTLDDYLAFPHAVVALGVTAPNPVDDALGALGRARLIGFTGQSFLGSLYAIRETDLVMSLPSRLLPQAEALGFSGFELPLRLNPYPYGIIWHRRTEAEPALMWLRNEIVSLFGKAAAPG